MTARRRVLVIDDEQYNRELLVRTLGRLADVVVAADADEALAACAATGFDLIVTDQRLGATVGTDLAPRLRATLPAARIVVLTGYPDDAAVVDALRTGIVDDVIGKPFAPLALRTRLLG